MEIKPNQLLYNIHVAVVECKHKVIKFPLQSSQETTATSRDYRYLEKGSWAVSSSICCLVGLQLMFNEEDKYVYSK